MNREARIKDTQREDGRWGELSLAQIYNGIKYMFDFYVSEGGTGRR